METIVNKNRLTGGAVLFVLIAILMGACSPAASQEQTSTPTLISDPAASTSTSTGASPPTTAPTRTPTATFTPRPPTVTPWTPPPSATANSNSNAKPSHRILFQSCDYEYVTEGTALVRKLVPSSCEIFSMNPDGSNVAQLTDNDALDLDPVGSPDGQKIVFVSDRDGNYELYRMNTDGSGQARLTFTNYNEWEPSWSPDGTRILYRANRPGGVSEIMTIEADGGGEVTLLKHDEDEGYLESPSWSPDGARIAFAVSGIGNGFTALFVMNADGTGVEKLTGDGWYADPVWSPNGSKIAYEAASQNGGGDIEIFTMNPDGSGVTNLTKTAAREMRPAWSPDGSRIAFVRETSLAVYEIFVMDADGSNQVQLTSNEGSFYPSWLYVSDTALVQHPDCTAGWTRLEAGEQAMVSTQSSTPNRVRSDPSTTAEIIAQIHPGTVVYLIEGPVCADGLVFWRVQHAEIPGGSGWTAEGDGEEYWLDPEG